MLVFEDLHWADDALLDFVDQLAERVTRVPLLVLGTARPELLQRRPGWGGGKPNALAISLSPLSDEETARLMQALLEQPLLDAQTQETLLARAGGNPLYAEQYARMLLEQGDLEELPDTVQGIIAARLDALAEDEKRLLQDAAVVGKVFWLGALAALDGTTRPQADDLLFGLERKEFVQRARSSSVAGENEYAFRHLLIRDIAYGQIPRATRAEKHRLAAGWIESLGRPDDQAEMLAHHYLAALELAEASGAEATALGEFGPAWRFGMQATGRPRSTRSRRPSASTTPRSASGRRAIPSGPSSSSAERIRQTVGRSIPSAVARRETPCSPSARRPRRPRRRCSCPESSGTGACPTSRTSTPRERRR